MGRRMELERKWGAGSGIRGDRSEAQRTRRMNGNMQLSLVEGTGNL